MSNSESGISLLAKVAVIVTIFVLLGSLVVYQTGFFADNPLLSKSAGLTDRVVVKGSVRVEQLKLSGKEVRQINRAVSKHAKTFSQVALYVDSKVMPGKIVRGSTLEWAMVLDAGEGMEVRSWSRKVSRIHLVPEVVMYMDKAAKEFKHFKAYPDVQQSFKCLYI